MMNDQQPILDQWEEPQIVLIAARNSEMFNVKGADGNTYAGSLRS